VVPGISTMFENNIILESLFKLPRDKRRQFGGSEIAGGVV
jgi:hypothetical protein